MAKGEAAPNAPSVRHTRSPAALEPAYGQPQYLQMQRQQRIGFEDQEQLLQLRVWQQGEMSELLD